MKSAILLVLALIGCASSKRFLQDAEYIYDIEASSTVGTMDYATFSSGYSYKMRARIQIKDFTMNTEFTDVKFSQFAGGHETKVHPFDDTTYVDGNREQIPAFSIKLDRNGLFKEMTLPRGANTMQKNTFRGFATLFQINTGEIKKGNFAFKSKEKTLHGNCDVSYTVTKAGVLKTVAHLSDCEDMPKRMYDSFGFRPCGSEHHESHPKSLANTFFSTKQNGDGTFKLDSVKYTSSFVDQNFEEEGHAFMYFTNFTAVLVDQKSSSGDINPSGQTIDDLKYQFHDEADKWNVDRELKNPNGVFELLGGDQDALVEKFKSAIVKQKEFSKELAPDNRDMVIDAHKFGLRHLSIIAGSLKYDEIMGMADEYINGDKNTRSAFLGVISSAGSTASAMAVRDMVMNRQVDDYQAARMLTTVPFHIMKPNTQLVGEFEKLLKTDLGRFSKMAARLSLAHMVKKVCSSINRNDMDEIKKCSKEFASQHAKRIMDDYNGSNDHDEKVNLLNELGNVAFGGIYGLLKPIIDGKTTKCPTMRTSALWAAFQELLYRGKATEVGRRLFFDRENSYVLRIHALEVIFAANPSAADLSAVMVTLLKEKNYEVLNYAYSLIERYADNPSPCQHETSHLAKYYLKFMQQYANYDIDWKFGASRTWKRQFFKNKYGYGGKQTFFIVGSEKSTFPVALGMTASTQYNSRFESTGLAVFLNVAGVSKALVKKFKKTDPTAWKLDDLKAVLKDMNIREREDQPVSVMIHIMVKGVSVISRTYGEDDFKDTGKIGSYLAKMKGKGNDGTVEYNRMIKLGSLVREVPSGMGHPVVMANGMLTLFGMTAKTKKGNHRGMLYAEVDYELRSFSQGFRAMMLVNPFRKNIYSIGQDRIYSANMPRKIVAGINPLKRELKLSVSRPEVSNPWRLFMHSVTAVSVRDLDQPDSLKTNCPSCNLISVVSRGPDAATDRLIADRESTKMGGWFKAGYFDCEMDVSRKNTIGHAIGAFSPYNKSPKTLFTSLTMGIRQIAAFFFLYPKNEKCGLSIQYSQSRTNPVKEIELTIRGSGEKTDSVMFFEGKKILMKAFLKAKGEPADRVYKINFAYEYGPNRVNNKMKMQIQRPGVDSVDLEPLLVCVAYESKYPDFPKKYFEFDPDKKLSNTGKAMIQYGRQSSCSDNDGEIRVTFDHSTTDYNKGEIKNTWYYKDCMKQKNNVEGWKERNDLPISESCYRTLMDATSARKYTWNVQFVKLTNRVKKVLSTVQTAIRAGLLPYWDVDPDTLGADGNVGPFLNVEAEFKNNEKNMDLSIETRLGKEQFTDIPLRLDWTQRMRGLRFGGTLMKLYNSRIINPCIVSLGDIRTNDNVTMPYTAPSCWTLASATCGPEPHYAVFMKKQGSGMAVNAYIGGHLVELTPDGGVKVNGARKNIADKGEYKHTSAGTDIFTIYRWGTSYNVYSSMRVMVLYDRSFIEVIPAPSAKGQHCGICGNYNRNPFDELIGKNNEKLGSVQKFIDDWKQKC